MRLKGESTIKYLEAMVTEMNTAYAPFQALYYDIADYLCPTLPQFASTDVNLGDRRSTRIVDSTASLYAQTEQAGMMTGITSPSRPWFKLAVRDTRKTQSAAAKKALADTNQLMLTTLLLSNFYTEMMPFYENAIHFGTSVLCVEEDLTGKVIKFRTLPTGSFRLMDGPDGKVNALCFTFRYTVRNLLTEFATTDTNGDIDWSNFSKHVKQCVENQAYDEVIEVRQVVCPNPDYMPGAKLAKDKKFWSYYYEVGENTRQQEDVFLKKSGYDLFPFLAFRWKRNPGDIYATNCPAIMALSDVKQLQAMEETKLIVNELQAKPPTIAPSSLEAKGVNAFPGGITYVDETNQGGLRPLYEFKPNLADHEVSTARIRDRLARAFHVHLFQTISQADELQTGKMTATEVRAREQESMRQLGPVLEQLNDSVFAPLIDILFEYLHKQGLLPQFPPEMQGEDLKIEYISIMAQAQLLEGLVSNERFLGIVQQVAQFDNQVLDVVNSDSIIRDVASILSINPNSTNPQDETDALRKKRSALVEAQQRAATIQQAGQGIAGLASAVPEEGSVLEQQMAQLQAAGITQGGGA